MVQTFKAHGFIADMYSTYLLKTARDKLPMALKVKWSEFVVDNNLNNPGLFELQQWMEKQSRASELLQESEPTTSFGSSSKKFPHNYNVNNTNKHKTSNQATFEPYAYQSSSQQNSPKKVHKCPIDEEEHYVGKCPKFLAMTVAERIDEIKNKVFVSIVSLMITPRKIVNPSQHVENAKGNTTRLYTKTSVSKRPTHWLTQSPDASMDKIGSQS